MSDALTVVLCLDWSPGDCLDKQNCRKRAKLYFAVKISWDFII